MIVLEVSGPPGLAIAPCIVDRIVSAFDEVVAFFASNLSLLLRFPHEKFQSRLIIEYQLRNSSMDI